jgi:hypothetical protein
MPGAHRRRFEIVFSGVQKLFLVLDQIDQVGREALIGAK